MTEIGYDDRTRAPDPQPSPQHAASGALDAVGSAASDTAAEARQQTRQVAGEVRAQARSLAADAKERVSTEARGQNDRLAVGIRRFADELDDMVRDRDDSAARGVVTQVSQGGRRVADYLAQHGPDGVLREVQDFARRRPGTFLAVAATAGFVVGRLGKGVFNAEASATGSSGGASLDRRSASAGSVGAPYGQAAPASASAWAVPATAVTDGQPVVPAEVGAPSSAGTLTGTPGQQEAAPTLGRPVTTSGGNAGAGGADGELRDARS
jgi:hypothetical protein